MLEQGRRTLTYSCKHQNLAVSGLSFSRALQAEQWRSAGVEEDVDGLIAQVMRTLMPLSQGRRMIPDLLLHSSVAWITYCVARRAMIAKFIT